MALIDTVKSMLIRHEGLKLMPYTDTKGKLTIGVGRNLTDRGISNSEAMTMLYNDINMVIAQIQNQFGWYEGLSDNRKAVIIDLVFNLGIAKFMGFSKTIQDIATGSFDNAANEMLISNWAVQVGDRAKELSEMMRNG